MFSTVQVSVMVVQPKETLCCIFCAAGNRSLDDLVLESKIGNREFSNRTDAILYLELLTV